MTLSKEQVDTIKQEIKDFQGKATQHAKTPTLSAYYHRLYLASSKSLKTIDRIARAEERKAYLANRKHARAGQASTATGTGKQRNA